MRLPHETLGGTVIAGLVLTVILILAMGTFLTGAVT